MKTIKLIQFFIQGRGLVKSQPKEELNKSLSKNNTKRRKKRHIKASSTFFTQKAVNLQAKFWIVFN